MQGPFRESDLQTNGVFNLLLLPGQVGSVVPSDAGGNACWCEGMFVLFCIQGATWLSHS